MTTKVNTNDITYFAYNPDLKVDPPLAKSKTGKLDSEFLELKTTTDEDVTLVNGEITVISNEVTTVKSKYDAGRFVYGFDALLKTVQEIAQRAKDNGSSLDGQVALQCNEDNDYTPYRILVTRNKVEVQEGKRAALWPDGTVSPL